MVEKANPKPAQMDESEYICDYCSRSFSRKYNLLTHIENCHINKSCYCDICEQRFGSPAGLQLHLSRGHNRHGEALPECDLCGRIFKRKQNIVSHMLTIHMQLHRQIKCNICCKFFRTEHNLRRHINQIHYPKYDSLSCDDCNKFFKGKRSLMLHIKRVHEKKIPRCNICGKTFRTKKNLKRHLNTHNRNKAKYKCELCSKIYYSSQSLRRHLRSMHYDKIKYGTPYSEVTSRDNLQKRNKERNTLQYFEELQNLNLICDTCSVSFDEESVLRQHIKKDHRFEDFYKYCKKMLYTKSIENHYSCNGYKRKEYHCEFCPQTFPIINDLKCHMKFKHTVQYRFSRCNVCYKKFISRESLLIHKRICFVPPNVNYCNLCHKIFTIKSSLEFHMKLFHSQTSDSTKSNDRSCNKSVAVQNVLIDKQIQSAIYKKIFWNNLYLHKDILSLKRCRYCKKVFKSRENMEQHVEVCPKKPNHKCTKCMGNFKDEDSLQEHVRTTHVIQSEDHYSVVYKCVTCDSVFEGKATYEEHKKNHKQPHFDQFPYCIICVKRFSSRKTLKRHIKNFHTEFQVDELADYGGLKQGFNVQCEGCIKNFTDDYYYGIYQKWKDVPTSVIFKCETCKSSYSCLEYMIQRHKQKLITTKSKLYLSELCTTEMSDTESQMGPNESNPLNTAIKLEMDEPDALNTVIKLEMDNTEIGYGVSEPRSDVDVDADCCIKIEPLTP